MEGNFGSHDFTTPFDDVSSSYFVDHSIINSIENEIDTELVDELTQEFDISAIVNRQSCGDAYNLEESSLKDFLSDLEDDELYNTYNDDLEPLSFDKTSVEGERRRCDVHTNSVVSSVESCHEHAPRRRVSVSHDESSTARTGHNSTNKLQSTTDNVPTESIVKTAASTTIATANVKTTTTTSYSEMNEKIRKPNTMGATTTSTVKKLKTQSKKSKKIPDKVHGSGESKNVSSSIVLPFIRDDKKFGVRGCVLTGEHHTIDAKEARKRRMDTMLERQLGRYHLRRLKTATHEQNRNRSTGPTLAPEEIKFAAKAAVAAVLDKSTKLNSTEVARVARKLLLESSLATDVRDKSKKRSNKSKAQAPLLIESMKYSPQPNIVTSCADKILSKKINKRTGKNTNVKNEKCSKKVSRKKVTNGKPISPFVQQHKNAISRTLKTENFELLGGQGVKGIPKLRYNENQEKSPTKRDQIFSANETESVLLPTQTPPSEKINTQLNSPSPVQGPSTTVNQSINSNELPDGDDAESRRQRRLIRNRMSAQLHRERKREAMDTLKKQIQERDVQLVQLRNELTQVRSKNYSLEFSIDLIKRHCGTDTINQILADCPRMTASVSTSTLPDVVNSSTSDFSEDDSTSTPSSCLPSMLISPLCNGVKHGTGVLPAKVISCMPPLKGRKRIAPAIYVGSSRKKSGLLGKKSNLISASSLAFCAFVGCTMLAMPTKLTSYFKDTQQQKFTSDAINDPLSELGSSNNWINKHSSSNPDLLGEQDQHMRRRLLSVMSSSGESPIDQIASSSHSSHDEETSLESSHGEETLSDSSHNEETLSDSSNSENRKYALSPIEMYPSLWKVNHTEPYSSPWLARNSRQLFDRRAEFVDSDNLVTSSAISSLAQIISGEKEKLKNVQVLSTAKVELKNVTHHLRGSIARNVNVSSVQRKELNTGMSYFFCPSARASLSPGLLELSGISDLKSHFDQDVTEKNDRDTDLFDENYSSLFSSDVNDDNSKQIIDGGVGVGAQIVRPNSGSRFFVGNDNEYPIRKEGESKALVPSLLSRISTKFRRPTETVVRTVLRDAEYMTILVPASTLFGDVMVEGFGNPSVLWVELSCHVLSARLINDVDFKHEDDWGEE